MKKLHKDNELIVYRHLGKQVGLLLLSLLMTTVFLFVVVASLQANAPWWLLALWIVVFMIFVACTIASILRLFMGKRLLVVADKGIVYDCPAITTNRDKLITWEEIDRVEEKIMKVKGSKQRFVSIYLKNAEVFLGSLSLPARLSAEANIAMGFGEININLQTAKEMTNQKLIEIINKRLER